jgi:hypothetical protein
VAGVAVLAVVSACGGDDDGAPPTTTAPVTSTTGRAPGTSVPPACADLAEDYLEAFFALGAGTPEDPDATTVRLPVGELLAIDAQAREAGCQDFTDVACSAYAELDDQGLRPVNSDPPASC